MKTKEETIQLLASKAYSNYMSGEFFMMRGVDIELASWIYGEDIRAHIKDAVMKMIETKVEA
jgi:hypothetical protein